MKRNLISMLLITVTAISLTACSSSKVPASAGGSGTSASRDATASANALWVVVKYSVTCPSTGTQAEGVLRPGELTEEYSDGRMKMEFYPSSQLGDKTATPEGLGNGTIEITEYAAMDLSTFNDTQSVFSLPYPWENGQQACAAVMDPAVHEMLEADARANGSVTIAWTDTGSRSMMNQKKTINTPADLTGFKIRCMQDPILADPANAMGAIATPLGANEIYTGLQQGTIDGLDHTPSIVVANGRQELAEHFPLTEHFAIPDPASVSRIQSDGLSAGNQEAVLEAGKKFSDIWNNKIWPEATENGVRAMKEQGVEVVEVDKVLFEGAVEPVVDKFLADANEDRKALCDLLTKTRKNYQWEEIRYI